MHTDDICAAGEHYANQALIDELAGEVLIKVGDPCTDVSFQTFT